MQDAQSFESVFARLMQITGAKTDSSLARILQIKPQSVVAARKRRQIPPSWLLAVAQRYAVTTDWLFFGIGQVRVREFSSARGGETKQEAERLQDALAEKRLAEQAARIQELERQLADAKDEALKAYRLAVEAMRPAVDAVQVPSSPLYGHKPEEKDGNAYTTGK